ncbi:hypothetical protein CYMTET_41884 [Cymbomonas tetramitiformis]|uniref:Mannosylglycerate hydrolase MGH1-like glycoside hydrolase domain-containing protein n=1 Tax=Cymbomonas tetramitiformis TaxID=36881 RepID=A0AAE0C6J4_9CHLO|nr:hypothetical protein CYMTET_41884 [Cymbomonas tetramitiformis]
MGVPIREVSSVLLGVLGFCVLGGLISVGPSIKLGGVWSSWAPPPTVSRHHFVDLQKEPASDVDPTATSTSPIASFSTEEGLNEPVAQLTGLGEEAPLLPDSVDSTERSPEVPDREPSPTTSSLPPEIHVESYRALLNESFDWVVANAPHFECSDEDVTQAYWYRWRLFKLHTVETPEGYVITEFLPKVFWSGPHNTISCPAGHHIMEGRWVKDSRIVDDYSRWWFRRVSKATDKKVWEKMYSFWAASAVYQRHLVVGNDTFVEDIFDDLVHNYASWRATHYSEQHGCMFQVQRVSLSLTVPPRVHPAGISSWESVRKEEKIPQTTVTLKQ